MARTNDEPDAADPAARRRAGFMAWDLLIILDLLLLGALAVLVVLAGPAQEVSDLSPAQRRQMAWLDVAFGFLLLGAIPALWVVMTRRQPLEGTLRYLRLKVDSRHAWPYWLGWGCLLAVGIYAAVLALFMALHWTGVDPGGDPNHNALARVGSWPLMVAIAVGAGVGEEVMFRGILQRWLGWVGQAAVFGVLHINQGLIAVAFITALALVFGFLLKRGMPLWALMIGHTAYDLLVLGQMHIGAQS